MSGFSERACKSMTIALHHGESEVHRSTFFSKFVLCKSAKVLATHFPRLSTTVETERPLCKTCSKVSFVRQRLDDFSDVLLEHTNTQTKVPHAKRESLIQTLSSPTVRLASCHVSGWPPSFLVPVPCCPSSWLTWLQTIDFRFRLCTASTCRHTQSLVRT